MAADEKKTLKDAKEALDSIAGFSHITESQASLIEKDFKEQKLPLETIQTSIAVIRKNTEGYRKNIDQAKKELVNVEKFKSADAVAMAKKLEAGIKTADKIIDEFEKSLVLFDKVWTKCWDAEKSLRQSLEKGIEAAREELKPMSRFVVDLPAKTETLHADCGKKLSNPVIKASLDTLAQEVKDCGANVTTAQSVVSWIETVLKGRGVAYHPDVARLAESADKLQEQLGKYATMAKKLIGEALEQIKEARALLAQPPQPVMAQGSGGPPSSNSSKGS